MSLSSGKSLMESSSYTRVLLNKPRNDVYFDWKIVIDNNKMVAFKSQSSGKYLNVSNGKPVLGGNSTKMWQLIEISQLPSPAITQSSKQKCYGRNGCNAGYQSIFPSNQIIKNWACANNCSGGKLVNVGCNCACVPNSDCQQLPSPSSKNVTEGMDAMQVINQYFHQIK